MVPRREGDFAELLREESWIRIRETESPGTWAVLAFCQRFLFKMVCTSDGSHALRLAYFSASLTVSGELTSPGTASNDKKALDSDPVMFKLANW